MTFSINGIAELDISSSGITDLTGIQDFVALTNLNCNSNQLTSLNLSGLQVLASLTCEGNQLTSLNVRGLKNLRYLYCKENPSLSCIQVANKYYADSKWQNNKDITASFQESCSGSGYTLIPDVNFENKLIELGFDSGTADGEVLTSSIDTITVLDVSSSGITDLTGIQDFSALTNLNCKSNQLTTLDVSKNSALISLDCANNQITSINIKNTNNSNMTYLDFLQNPNLSCIQVDNKLYADTNWENYKNTSATYEEICTNFIEPVYTLIPDINFESYLIEAGLDKGTFDGKVLTSAIETVTDMGIPGRNITDLTGIQDFAALKELFCNNNQLTTLDLSKNIKLTFLNCDENQLTTLDVSKNISLKYLSCILNQLPTLDVSKNIELTFLNWAGNNLTELDVSKNISLEGLICGSVN
ncbi:hypothetical protein ACFQZF_08620 [Flavobacterium myungsuense]|uniref:hypothetical protein n=1 Tax=Flavobacterium myungsuense TaxID=651823 RepID=UPI00363FB08E